MRSFNEMMNLKGRVAVVTGGAGYLGRAIAETLAELGADLAVVDMQQEACENFASSLQSTFAVSAMPIKIDLAVEDQVRQVPDLVKERFGRMDILINCAALVGTSNLKGWGVPFQLQNADTWRLALETNLTAAFVLCQVCTDLLKASGHGSIINVLSIYALVGPNMSLYAGTSMGNPAAYGASKAGLLQLTRYLATALAPDIRVNALTPGGIFRNQLQSFLSKYEALTPMGRMATEEDFKGAVGYLASDLSAYMTGQNLVIDGGWTVW